MNFSDVLINQMAQLGALATRQEIELRLLADKTNELEHLAHAQPLQKLEDAFFESFAKHLEPSEVESIKAGRVIRNKILHGDFKAASLKAASLEAGLMTTTKTYKVDLGSGETKKVEDLSIEEGKIVGWLIASSQNGFVPAAQKIFNRNIETLVRISSGTATGTIQPTISKDSK
jgi:hypothetical protein